ncbi:NAD(P)-binding protein [Hesseltinella vesiculosa]|uniref:Dihydropteridine reductase n=1 Tax=Hesseltinella vesiculosa TaxID=101127 RepID=A0A1X2GEU0_9FUNG|nr:NAD(P)-binding protein [Hesseltinella vesiculosa]
MPSLAVYGGAGALGRALVTFFKNKGYFIINIDLVENTEANSNALVNIDQSLEQQGQGLDQSLTDILKGDKLDALLCVAGGWAGGNAASKSFLSSADLMVKQSVNSSLVAGYLAARHLKAGGLLSLTGALAALGPTPGMMGYGLAKAAVHQYTQSLAQEGSGLPELAKAIALCPVTIDTPMNRQGMPDADFSSWTSPSVIAEQLEGYMTGSIKVESGKLISVVTKDNVTSFTEA